ncbi:DinB family protein [Burkholderia ambifaria]|uniref:DinB family protein n=1 Tax=Burkholderia ambifaria TaxID=152480 RepID=UPI001FC7D365|nr:DinB family protein [Burkholderia ambifaria]
MTITSTVARERAWRGALRITAAALETRVDMRAPTENNGGETHILGEPDEETIMSANALLSRMLRYQAWANDEMLKAMSGLDAVRHAQARHLALRLMNHCLVVNRIFAAHLSGERHGFVSDNTPDTPEPEALRAAFATLDRWYLDYVEAATPDMLSESIPFVFTDGDNGYMTREEMLTHVVTHGGYHRGEAGRLMLQAAALSAQDIELPWDTYAVHLHRTEPERRLQRKIGGANSANAGR